MFTAAGQLSWTADDDYVFKTLTIATTSANTCIVTTDPTLTQSAVAVPTSQRIIEDLLFASNASGRNQMVITVPIVKGQTLFVSVGAATSVTMYLFPAETLT